MVKKGDKVKVTGNSIFKAMGYDVVTGTVFMVYPDGHGFSLRCDQTSAMETADFGDGNVEVQQ